MKQKPPGNQPNQIIIGAKKFIIHYSLFIIIFYVLLTLILTYPLIFNLASTVPNDIGDPLLNTWILAWDAHALLTDPPNLFNANIFHPLPKTLAYSEHLLSTALLALPFQLVTGEPVVAYNLSLLATFPLAAFGMYLLAFHWTRQRHAAFIAGLIFAFAPYRFAAIAHLQLLTCQWLPFLLLFLDKILTTQPVSNLSGQPTNKPAKHQPPLPFLLALILFLIFQILASWYLALYTALIVSIYLLVGLLTRQHRWRNLPGLILAFIPVILIVLPLAIPYLDLIENLRQARPLSQALALAATPTDFVTAPPFNRLFGPLTESWRTRSGFTEENTLFTGFIGPMLVLVTLLTLLRFYGSRLLHFVTQLRYHASRLTLPALHSPLFALLIVLSLSLALTFPTPYAALVSIFPPGTIVRVPPRWIIPALFAMSGLAAFGYAIINEQLIINNAQFSILHSRFRISRLLLAFCLSLFVAESFSSPIPLAQVDNRHTLNPTYHWLAEQFNDFALIELPLHSAPAPEFPEVKRLYASTLGWWPLVNGYSGYTPPRQPKLARALTAFPDQHAINELQKLATGSAPTVPSPLSLFLLIHPGQAPMDRTQWETVDRWQAERNANLYPLGQFEGDYLYQVLPHDPNRFTAPPLATFGPAQNIRLLAINATPRSERTSSFPVLTHNSTFKIQNSALTLFWQTDAPIPTDYTVFIHLRAADGFVHSQADGPPVSGHYPTTAWQPGEIIQDIHPLPSDDFTQIDHLAIGLYDPLTDQRLSAFGPNNSPLTDDALIIPLN